jgi:hypothetical protein
MDGWMDGWMELELQARSQIPARREKKITTMKTSFQASELRPPGKKR